MEALSPRSANIPTKSRSMKQKEVVEEDAKKAEAAKKALKEKDYAPPPPEWVLQPPIAKGGLAEKFKTGQCLGKGGFAMCYEGELRGRKAGTESTVFALKVVKAKMSQRKMEEKVHSDWHDCESRSTNHDIVSNRATDSRKNAAPKYRRVPSGFHLQREYFCCT